MRWSAALALALGATACANPCETLAARVCGETRQPDPVCQRLRAIADAPTAQDRRTCEAANAAADDFKKQ